MTPKQTIIDTCTQVGLSLSDQGLDDVEQGIKDELGIQALGLLIGGATGKPGFSYKRVAERIYRVLETQNAQREEIYETELPEDKEN